MKEDDFTPSLGRQGNRGRTGNRQGRYGAKIAAKVRRQGTGNAGLPRAKRPVPFTGSRVGRGGAVGRLLSTRQSLQAPRSRRALVKASVIRLGARGMRSARAHLRYLQRDGVTRDGRAGELYGPDHDCEAADGFLARSGTDRHQFRLIVSLEDGDRYDDLKPYVRRLMTEVSRDLETGLEWVAVDHHDTGHPHSHIVLRGVDDGGRDLVIARDYIADGLRERAIELVTRDLGPVQEREITERMEREVHAERMTAIDLRLLARRDRETGIALVSDDPVWRAAETGRLRALAQMGLASGDGAGQWHLHADLEPTLVQMGERLEALQLLRSEARRIGEPRDLRINSAEHAVLVGEVRRWAPSDAQGDRWCAIVDGVDGRLHYLALGRAGAQAELPGGAVIRVTAASRESHEMDRTISSLTRENNGVYSSQSHRRYDPQVNQATLARYERRLEALHRHGVTGTRNADGSWDIHGDHLDRAAAIERRSVQDRPFRVEILSATPLATLSRVAAVTWLDRELDQPSVTQARDAGFGRELANALAIRRQWLINQELMEPEPGRQGRRYGQAPARSSTASPGSETAGHGHRLRPDAFAQLQRRELLQIAAGLSQELGMAYVETAAGAREQGRVARRVEGVSGSYALLEKSREFTLVPWRPAHEKALGQQSGGIEREDVMRRHIERGRGGPEIG